jgi:membrane-bound serine protease (ClpP class)
MYKGKLMIRALFLTSFLPLFLAAGLVVHTDIKEPISPATTLHVNNTLNHASQKNADLVLFHIDTPGGLLTSTREITRAIADSPVPVVVYVTPRGAHAASAGTFILYSAHIAAMTPGTNIGAATPVSMMGRDNNQSSAMQTKILEDTTASIRALAALQDRNATWGELAITKGKSISADEALTIGAIEFIAQNQNDLLAQIEGHMVQMGNDNNHTISLNPIEVITFEPDTKTKFLRIISNPNIAYIFVMLALYGIFFELMNPGSIFPGVIGGISGLIALYALNILPFNQAGLLLLVLGVLLMVAEVFVAGFGLLGLGGAVAFVIGSMMLFDHEVLGQDIAWPIIVVTSLVSVLFFILLLGFVFRSRKAKSMTGKDTFIGLHVKVLSATNDGYRVEFQGEIWNAYSKAPLSSGDYAIIQAVEGLHLYLKPKEK